jgi:hypothetical protein
MGRNPVKIGENFIQSHLESSQFFITWRIKQMLDEYIQFRICFSSYILENVIIHYHYG